MVRRLESKNTILCTSRQYNEVTNLAKIRKFNLKVVGKHGGRDKFEKLSASISRMNKLSELIRKFSPDITISFCSPEASRISFGLGIKHIAFSDSPHADAVMRLSVPFVQKLLIPWIIPKNEFEKFGISSKDIIQYKSLDAISLSKRDIVKKPLPFSKDKKKIILFRLEEDKAAYAKHRNFSIPLIKSLVEEFRDEKIVILCRYESQTKKLRKLFGNSVILLPMTYDGKLLLTNCNIFIGSGGTMTAESAVLGIPTISYDAVPNFIEDYLVKQGLIKRVNDPKKIKSVVKTMLTSNQSKSKLEKMLKNVEDPFSKLKKIIEES